MLYGHIETLEDRVDHFIQLRESQERSPGFNAFIPLAFHPDGNELSDCGWTTGLDDLRTFAVARLMLNNFDHIKAYWMIQGLKVCQVALHLRRRRHGRHARLDRRGDDLSLGRHAVGAVRRRSRVPPPDRRRPATCRCAATRRTRVSPRLGSAHEPAARRLAAPSAVTV